MTIINDPGTTAIPAQAESYNATSRPWRTTAGLWRGDARDTSGGAHPTGFVSGQLWSVTAGQWQTMNTANFNAQYVNGAGTGETWQQAAARLTPYGPPPLSVTTGVVGSNTDTGNGNWTALGGAAAVSRDGYWIFVMRGSASNFASGANAGWRFLVNGGVADSGTGGNGWSTTGAGLTYGPVSLSNGATFQMQYYLDNQSFSGSVSFSLTAYFIPTPANPH